VDREEEERRMRLTRALQAQHAEAGSLLTAPPDGGGMPVSAAPGRVAPQPLPPLEPQPSTFVRSERKVGRNEPCPCGSGKKFKHCHGALSAVE
jgi:preprotein translocase subunit SecA